MISAQIDPAIVAIPNFADDADMAQRYLDIILNLSASVAGVVGFQIVKSKDIINTLYENDAFPFKSRVQEYLDLYDLGGVYSANDIVNVLHNIINRADNIEDAVGFEVRDARDILTVPDVLFDRFPIALRQASGGVLFNAAISDKFSQPGRRVLCIHGPFCDHPTIEVTGQVGSFSGERQPDIAVANDNGPQTLHLISQFSDLAQRFAAIDLWRSARDADGCHLSIAFRALEISAGNKRLGYRDLEPFLVGSRFFESLQRNQATGDDEFGSLVLDSCARVVLGIPKEQIGNLTNKDGDIVTRKFDSAEACRTHLTSKGQGLRLMFWKTKNGPEFATVGVKQELDIDAGVLIGRAGPQRSTIACD